MRPSVRCISASLSSAPATIRPAGATRAPRPATTSLPVIQEIAPHRRARQVRPVVHLRRAGHGPGRPPVIPVPLRADDADLGAERHRRAISGSAPRSRRALTSPTTSPASSPRSTTSAGGRAAWNVVTSSQAEAALNFSLDRQMDHELRYEVAKEFVDVVKGLWDCWDDGAIVADKATGRYIDAGQGAPARPQGPVLPGQGPDQHGALPAGASGHHPGRRLALGARTGGAHRRCRLFGGAGAGSAKKAYADLKGRMAKYGRAPGQARGIARGHADHRRRARPRRGKSSTLLQSWLTPTNAADPGCEPHRLRRVRAIRSTGRCRRRRPARAAGRSHRVLYEIARRENMTLARPLQPDRRGARPLGPVRHAERRSPTRWKSGSSRGPPTGSTYCRPISPAPSPISSTRGAGIAAPRPVPPRLRGHHLARPFRPAAGAAAGAEAPRPWVRSNVDQAEVPGEGRDPSCRFELRINGSRPAPGPNLG